MANPAQENPFHLVVVAGGSGRRFGDERPKQYIPVHRVSILRHTLDNALRWPGLQSLHVVINPAHQTFYDEAVEGLDLPPPINGGTERKDSVYNALRALSHLQRDEVVLFHDAARPLTKAADVMRLLDSLHKTARAATLACPVTDTLRRSRENDHACDIVDREKLWGIQTPQGFRYGDIKDAHEKADAAQNYTDDTSLVSACGIDVELVKAARTNIKITAPEDMTIARALLSPTTSPDIRTGMGFDVHAFETETGKPLILCGIPIDHHYGLSGHSDADVALHALTDALLGAIGAGDIGQHFPPSDPAFKDMDSAVFIRHALALIEEQNGIIQNVDLTIICEEPKITPHRERMQNAVSDLLGLPAGRVNIKATTTEKLGFTGRGEGIAAQAVATVIIQREHAGAD